MRLGICVLIASASLLAGSSPASADRYAVVVGVEGYQHPDLRTPPLKYAVDDAAELGDVLRAAGYEVVALTDDSGKRDKSLVPSKGNITAAVARVLKRCQKNDTVLVALAGHGLQFAGEKDAYFCPVDARPFQRTRDSLVSIRAIYDDMEASFAGAKVILIDACRNDPDPARGRDALTADTVPPPRGVGVLFSCSPGQRAFEHDDLKHGLFFHQVIQRMRNPGPNGVTFFGLTEHVGLSVPANSRQLVKLDQVPNLQGNVFGSPVLIPARQRGSAEEVRNSLGMRLRLIPAGSFWMGSTAGQHAAVRKLDPDFKEEWLTAERPQHRVEITKPFYLGVHEVTRGQFARFVEATGYRTDAEKDGEGGHGFDEDSGQFQQDPKYSWRQTGFAYEEDHPVVNVSWNDATAFCDWLSREEKGTYRLPTQAQWEYACRAGSETLWSFGDDAERLALHGNVADGTAKKRFSGWKAISAEDGVVFTSSVGRYRPNGFGLFDMHGNAWEWCQDWYDADYYGSSPTRGPTEPSSGEHRVLRGGSWVSRPADARSGDRNRYSPTDRSDSTGFRVSRTP